MLNVAFDIVLKVPSWVRFLSNELELSNKFFFSQSLCFDLYFFDKKLIVPNNIDNTFLFYFDICTNLTLQL